MDHFKKSAHFDVVNMEISSRVYFLQWHHQLIRLADEKVNFSCEVVVILHLQENIGCGYTLEVFPRDAKNLHVDNHSH